MTANEIIFEVCDYFHVDENFINTSKRYADIIKIKHIAVFFIKKYTDLSNAGTGRFFVAQNSCYDHASISHAIKAVNNRYDTDHLYRKQIDNIDGIISAKIKTEEYHEKTEMFQENDFFTN